MAKILLADDSTHATRMGAKILTAEGHEVSTVSNGQAAVHALEKSPPDLVVADVFMPGRNGYEVCHYIKTDEKLKGIPVLLIIGAMEPYDPEEGRRAGADGLITKPLESSNLVATVNDLLSAAKRFAPARATAEEAAAIELEQQAPVTPQWEEMPEELITPAAPSLVIPQEMSQQPVGMLSDFMGMPEASGAAPAEMEPPEPPPIEAAFPPPIESPPVESPEEPPVPEPTLLAAAPAPPYAMQPPATEMAEPASLLSDASTAPQLDITEKTVWTATPAAMTPEEAKLFDASAANWGDLAHLVEETAAEVPASAPAAETVAPSDEPPATDLLLDTVPNIAVEADALLETVEKTEVEAGTAPEIEHYEDLSVATVAKPGTGLKRAPVPAAMESPVAAEPEPPAMAPEERAGTPAAEAAAASEQAPALPPWSGPVEELEAEPSEREAPLEQLVRRAVEDLMPEIVERVKQSLKS